MTPDNELATREQVPGLGRLNAQPIIDRLDPQQRALLKSTVAQNASDSELAMFLELAAHYDLDPFAKEIWCAKGKGRDGAPGRVLIMVGRDGLRKVAQRNGIDLTGGVVYENDDFEEGFVDGEWTIVKHTRGNFKDRGGVIGAWAMAYHRKSGKQAGYFSAPASEYRPANVSPSSPWSKQESVMMLAAVERQAARQATPLGGLLVEGEDEVINATATELPSPVALPPEVEERIERARKLGHAGHTDRAKIEMLLGGQDKDAVKDWCERVDAALDEMEAIETVGGILSDAEIVRDSYERAKANLVDRIAGAEADGDEALANDLREQLDALEADQTDQVTEDTEGLF